MEKKRMLVEYFKRVLKEVCDEMSQEEHEAFAKSLHKAPRKTISIVVRDYAERKQDISAENANHAFPAGLVGIILTAVGELQAKRKATINDLIPEWNDVEGETPAAFPKLMALVGAELLAMSGELNKML